MALQITEQLPAYNKPFPKVGCGLKFCFQEDSFVETIGQSSFLDIVLNLFAAVADGDSIILNGYKFTFISGSSQNLQQIEIGVALTDTATNLFNALNQIPFFIDNYTISNPSYQVQLTSFQQRLDENYFFSATTANVDSILINPFATVSAGVNPIVKEDYYLFFDIINTDDNEKLCSESLERPLNIFQDFSTKVCVNVQPIIEQFSKLFTHAPTPFQPLTIGTNKPDNFDENYFKNFQLRFWNSYKDNDSDLNCEKVQSDFIQIPSGSQLLTIANFSQKQDDCSVNGFNDYAFPPDVDFGQKFITSMPDSYRICQETAVEFRFEYPVQTIVSLGGFVRCDYVVNYSDGSNTAGSFDWDSNQDGCQVLNLSFGDNPNATIPTTSGKRIVSFDFQIYHVLFATAFNFLEQKTILFESSTNKKVKCCEDKIHFYFLSCVGNNDVLIGKETSTSLEVEFFEFCKEQTCCGSDRFGVNQQLGGKVTTGIKEENKIHRAIIETEEIDYLEDFLLSSSKYVYEPDTDSIFEILPTKNSFTIWRKNFRTVIEFTFRKSFLRKRLKK